MRQAARRKASERALEDRLERPSSSCIQRGESDAGTQDGDALGAHAWIGEQAAAHLLARHERAIEELVVSPSMRQAVLIGAHPHKPGTRTAYQAGRQRGDIGIVPAVADHSVWPPVSKNASYFEHAAWVQAAAERHGRYRDAVPRRKLGDAALLRTKQANLNSPRSEAARLLE